MVGHGEDQLPHARARHRASQPRRAERARRDQHRAGVGPHRPRRTAATPRSPARATARAGASTARSATSFPARATSATRSIAPTSPECGASTRRAAAARASMPTRSSARSTAARSRGCSRSASTRWSRCPTTTSSRRMLEKLEFYVAIDFFLNETARHADIVLPGSLHEEDEGTVTQVEGRVIKINKAVDCPGEARPGLAHHPGHRRGRWADEHGFTFAEPARDLRRAARRVARAASPTTPGITYEKIEQQHGRLLAVSRSDDHPGHAAAVRAGLVEPGREGRRAVLLPRRQGALQRRGVRAAGRGRRCASIRSS